MRVFLIILGVLMLLPGACGAIVLGIAIVEGDPGAMLVFSLPFILIGIGGLAVLKKQIGKRAQDDTQGDGENPPS